MLGHDIVRLDTGWKKQTEERRKLSHDKASKKGKYNIYLWMDASSEYRASMKRKDMGGDDTEEIGEDRVIRR